MKKIILSAFSLSIIFTIIACGPKQMSDADFKQKGDQGLDKMSDDDKKAIEAELFRIVTEKLDYDGYRKANFPQILIDFQKQGMGGANTEMCKKLLAQLSSKENKKFNSDLVTKVKANETAVKKHFAESFAKDKNDITPYQFGQCVEKLPEVAKEIETTICTENAKAEDVKKSAHSKFNADVAMQEKCAKTIKDFFDFADKLSGDKTSGNTAGKDKPNAEAVPNK